MLSRPLNFRDSSTDSIKQSFVNQSISHALITYWIDGCKLSIHGKISGTTTKATEKKVPRLDNVPVILH